MLTPASETLFPTLGPAYRQLCLVLARIWRTLWPALRGGLTAPTDDVRAGSGRNSGLVRSRRPGSARRGGSDRGDRRLGLLRLAKPQRGNELLLQTVWSEVAIPPRDLSPKWLVDRIGFDYTGRLVVSAGLGPKANDDTMGQVGQLDRLESLSLSMTNVTDKGVAHLEGLGLLRDLDLGQTKINDAGLAHLKGLKALRVITLWNTRVTDEGVLQLEEALPWAQIMRDEDTGVQRGCSPEPSRTSISPERSRSAWPASCWPTARTGRDVAVRRPS